MTKGELDEQATRVGCLIQGIQSDDLPFSDGMAVHLY